MSNISTVIDAIRTTIPTLTGFSAKSEIPNPYSLEDNSTHLLKDGWGLVVEDAINATPEEFKSIRMDRDFTVVLTRQLFKTAHDVSTPITQYKALLEDQFTVTQDFLQQDDDETTKYEFSVYRQELLILDKKYTLPFFLNFFLAVATTTSRSLCNTFGTASNDDEADEE